MSSLPLTVNGSAVNATTAAGTMYAGSRSASTARAAAGSAVPVTYPTSRLSPGRSSRAITTACSTPSSPASAACDFTELDAIPADLDLLIGAPQIPQLPVSAPTHQVPGAIHTLRPGTAERTRHKPRRRSTPARPTYPHAHPGAGHIQLPDHPGRHRPQPLIEHEQRRPRHRRPDRQRAPDPAVSGALIDAYIVVSVGP